MTEARKELSLFELNARVRDALQEALPERYWVRAEVSEARVHPSGHCYLELIEKEEATGLAAILSSLNVSIRKAFTRSELEPVIKEYGAVREMRKFVGWYLKGAPGSAVFRGSVNQITDAAELKRAIEEF